MATYIVRRVFQGVIILFLSTFLSYSIILLMPGGPQDQFNQLMRTQQGGGKIDPRYLEHLKKQYGLDQPYPLSYFLWLFDPNDTTETNY